MLASIQIRNFRCLRDVDAPLKPLTVLIGPNDSGKSAFLNAIVALVGNDEFLPGDHWRNDPENVIQLNAFGRNGKVSRSSNGERPRPGRRIVMPGNTKFAGGTEPIRLRVQVYQFPSQGILMISQGHRDDAGPPQIQPDGGNVPTLLDYHLRRDRKRFLGVVSTLKDLVPGLEDLAITTTDPATRQLDLIVENGLRIPADRSSTGVRLLIAFVALAYHPSPPSIILLEEPENGIHPKRLNDVFNLLRDITEGKLGGQASQVILTTHSPYLLDLIDPEREQVLVFQRETDGSRTAQSLDTSRLKDFLDEFMLGEVWYNQGEEGIVSRKAQ